MAKREKLQPPAEVGLGAERMTPRFRMPASEREFVEGVQSLGLFSAFRGLKRRNQLLFGIVISAALILYWRGLWWLYDLFWEYFLPEHRLFAAVASVTLGLVILVGSDYAVEQLSRS
ncbi:hypothetical protein COX86_04365 [Candidatus Micrarchaeota archaeon CG_4_10_14_0_2_um_filter_60_11]|nr:MAG: hypothetical protein AUJ16_01535 [Candidatus Micrarchaeota archaeon CG1_02_60_51]PIY91692.1 MAG: hypothetical protein COY71_01820 [Candidatus Micrarchaeota archaeon CG_4_10_14_0_8_um_filter_60_7]PIZ90543.1 MAG: hypothetical protein COX86_04365 [Candidatus Micrarchaeota archaeon CG_4_10_14_0_2_um_filter_60_11]